MQGSSTARGQRPKGVAGLAFVRVLSGVLGRAAGRRAVPVFVGLGMLSAVLLGPTGMRPSTLVQSFHRSLGFRVCFLAAWLVLVLPASAALFRHRDCDYLRCLPVPALVWWLVLGAFSLALQLPWAALWLAGGTVVEAAGAVSIAAAMSILFATYPRNWQERVVGWAVLGGLGYFVVAQPVSLWPTLGVPTFLLATVIAWDRAPDRGRPWDPLMIRGGPILALALAHVVAVWRTGRASLGRAVVVALVGVGLSALAVRANRLISVAEIAGFSMAISAISFAVVAGVLAAPLQDAQRELRWLLDTTGASGPSRAFATSGVLGVFMAVVGMLHGVAVGAVADTSVFVSIQVGLLLMAWSVGFGLFASRAARASEAVEGVDGTRLVSLVVACSTIAMVLLGWLGPRAAVAWLVAGVAVAATSIGRAPGARARTSRVRRW